jgi:hypothetical protein
MIGNTLLDFNLTEKEILRNFYKTAKLLVTVSKITQVPTEEHKEEETVETTASEPVLAAAV